MLSLTNVIIVLCLSAIGAFFWQLRKISEAARFHAQRLCNQRQLQFLSIARCHSQLGKVAGQGIGWHCKYLCEFSTDGINQLQATLTFAGTRLSRVDMPIYPEPSWEQAPASKGKVGIGGCGGGCSSKSCN